MENRPTRVRLLDAAHHLMLTVGLARATTKEIARAAGCSEAALYKHFASKEELFIQVLTERLPPLRPCSAASRPSPAGTPSRRTSPRSPARPRCSTSRASRSPRRCTRRPSSSGGTTTPYGRWGPPARTHPGARHLPAGRTGAGPGPHGRGHVRGGLPADGRLRTAGVRLRRDQGGGTAAGGRVRRPAGPHAPRRHRRLTAGPASEADRAAGPDAGPASPSYTGWASQSSTPASSLPFISSGAAEARTDCRASSANSSSVKA